MKRILIALPLLTTAVALPHDTHVLLDWPIAHNSLDNAGTFVGGVFTANTSGLYNFNVSSQAGRTEQYQVVVKYGEKLYKGSIGAVFGDGLRQISQKNITLLLKAGDIVELLDYQLGVEEVASRWGADDSTQRIEITFEG